MKNTVLRLIAVFLCSVDFSRAGMAQAAAPRIVWDTLITGHCTKPEVRSHLIYLPFRVGAGITGLRMQAWVTDPKENVLDIGIFDERGTGMGPVNGFRGWAGGVSNKEVHITSDSATASYIPGPLHAGTWTVLVVPTRIDKQGFDWRLRIALESSPEPQGVFVPHPARETVHHRPGWYRGDLHLHDINSDGVYTQEELARRCRSAGLDFFVSTNHNTYSANLYWGRYESDSLLILNGEEVTPMLENHWNAIGIDPTTWIEWRYNAGSGLIAGYQQQVREAGGLCIANHPFYDEDSVLDTRFPVSGFDGIEVWNGPWEQRDDYAVTWWDGLLRSGEVKTAIGASDSHRPTDRNIVGSPQTVVLSRGLDRRELIDGIRHGRCYIAEHQGMELLLSLRAGKKGPEALIGDTLRSSGRGILRATISIMGMDPNSVLTLISNQGIVYTRRGLDGAGVIVAELPAASVRYLRAEIRRADHTMEALTNPVWVR